MRAIAARVAVVGVWHGEYEADTSGESNVKWCEIKIVPLMGVVLIREMLLMHVILCLLWPRRIKMPAGREHNALALNGIRVFVVE